MSSNLTPSSLGLGPKFASFRPVQIQALSAIAASKKRFIMVQGPTGSGKTLICAAMQRLLNTKVLYSCHTKQLQSQFVDSFARDKDGNQWAVELKGRTNYKTLRYPGQFPFINASMCTGKKEVHCRWCCDGHCGGGEQKCLKKMACPYVMQKYRIMGASIGVVNTALLLAESNYVGAFSGWSWICLDECDLIESELLNFVQLEITQTWINKLGISPPRLKTVQEAWIEWAQKDALPAIIRESDRLESSYGVEDTKRQSQLDRMRKRMEFFLSEVGQSGKKWVFMPEEDRWTFKPVFISSYANNYLWKHADRFLLMSATIISVDEMCRTLGIPRDQTTFIDLPSTFPPERRPIYYIPAANLTRKTEKEERPKAIKAIDEILDKYPDKKVLVHSVSYNYGQEIISKSKYKSRMITYSNAQDRAKVLNEFKTSRNGTIMVASSMERGIDLMGDLCNVVILGKIPFGNLGDKQIAARLYSDKKHGRLWYVVNTIRSIVQASGRAFRSADDQCDIWIIDEQFSRLYTENKGLFPAWWKEALHMKSELTALKK